MRAIQRFLKPIACLVIAAFLAASLAHHPARAEMLATEALVEAASASQYDRARLRAVLEREDVRAQMEAQGIGREEAAARVESLTDREVSLIAGQIDSLPAGGMTLGVAMMLGTAIAVAAALILALIIWGIKEGVEAATE